MLLKLIAPAIESLPLAIMGDHWNAWRESMGEFAKIEPRAAAAPVPAVMNPSDAVDAAAPVPAVNPSDAAAAPVQL